MMSIYRTDVWELVIGMTGLGKHGKETGNLSQDGERRHDMIEESGAFLGIGWVSREGRASRAGVHLIEVSARSDQLYILSCTR